ncbi:hypothetical protein CDO52_19590 [Nocardiopsis gilva YIM 90087]|uniref:Uncharacterized protein n=1 Tax=Nocardiopsis gilva YIM 90087 TaxID=1235441 RepID=A0A223S9A8_9ACTN|nr:hypothetical protein [Nocardiopsis gilva]ASU84710.1 hypothetical protein CDO52_19590 [Nocardiopsis gilva YIM 90087]
MTSAISSTRFGDITVSYDPELPLLQRFTVRGRGGRIVRLGAPYGEARRALIRECKLSTDEASRLLERAAGVGSW